MQSTFKDDRQMLPYRKNAPLYGGSIKAPKLRNILAILFCALLLFATSENADAYDLVYDPLNWAENLLKQIEETMQTSLQNGISATASTISTINSTISQVTQYIYKLENLVQQAVGTVTDKVRLLEQLYGEIASIPASFQAAYQNILNIPNQFQAAINGQASWEVSAQFGGPNWANATDPITRYLGGALSALQDLVGLINQAGYSAENVGHFASYNSPAFAANLSQGLGAQTLKSQDSARRTITVLQTQAKNANTQQAGQAVDNQTKIQALAVQAQSNQLIASRQLTLGQSRTNELERYNTNVTGAETAAGQEFYNTFQP